MSDTRANASALEAIKSALGPNGYIDEPSRMAPYVTSMRHRHENAAPLVALPATTQDVARLVGVCREHRIAIVPQGGNTGLVDGGIPLPGALQGEHGEIVVSLARMNRIRDLDPFGMIVTAEAGVILQTLQDAADDAGFLFPLSMASEGSATVGGIISTNAGGTAVLRYGNMRHLVVGVEAVVQDGSVISGLRRLAKDNTGYDLAHAFVGAEGTLGIVTAATLRLAPKLWHKTVALAALPDADAALKLLALFRREGAEYLTAFEIMSRAALQLAAKHIPGARDPFGGAAPYALLIELGASSPHVDLRQLFEDTAARALEDGLMLDAVLAESEAQARQFWHVREHIPDALRRQGGKMHFDVSVPLDRVADFLLDTNARIAAEAPSVVPIPFGHIGDGNIHYNMYCDPAPGDDAFTALKARIKAIMYEEIAKRQGSISAEHGIGVERKGDLLLCKSPVEIDLMRRIKRAFDPEGLMNPGKIFD